MDSTQGQGYDVTDMGTNENPKLASIRNEWDWVKPGIEQILNESPQFAYRPEDVYAECINNKAHLWVTDDGFVVTTTEVDELREENFLYIWLAWSTLESSNNAVKHQHFFGEQAIEAGYDGLKSGTSSKKVADYLINKCGWQLDKIELVRRF